MSASELNGITYGCWYGNSFGFIGQDGDIALPAVHAFAWSTA